MARKLLFLWGFLLILAGSTSGELFTGEYFDDSTQLQYNRARWYAPNVGRFVSLDTFDGRQVNPLTLHKYMYAGSDPVNKFDPGGHEFNMSSLMSAVNTASIQISTRLILAGARYPLVNQVLSIAGAFILPVEMQIASQHANLSAFSQVALPKLLSGASHLAKLEQEFLARGGKGNFADGAAFERWAIATLGATKENIAVLGGRIVPWNTPGSARPDIRLFRESVIEIKQTIGATSKQQTQQLALYANRQSKGLTFLFQNDPGEAGARMLRRWVDEILPGTGNDVVINFIFK